MAQTWGTGKSDFLHRHSGQSAAVVETLHSLANKIERGEVALGSVWMSQDLLDGHSPFGLENNEWQRVETRLTWVRTIVSKKKLSPVDELAAQWEALANGT